MLVLPCVNYDSNILLSCANTPRIMLFHHLDIDNFYGGTKQSKFQEHHLN